MSISLSRVGNIELSGAEILAFDPDSQRAFVTTGDGIEILDFSDPSDIQSVGSADIGEATSVAVKNGLIAAAVPNADDETAEGRIVFLDADGTVLGDVTVGNLPDSLTFTPDGSKILVANEGEPVGDTDPLGSISIIDVSGGIESATVQTLTFEGFNGREQEFIDKGVRLFPDKTVAEDVEPEFIAVAPDGTTALVTLQENNAVAVVDIEAGEIVDILPLGTIDHSKGLPEVELFDFGELPVLGTTPAGQEIALGGLSGLDFGGTTADGKYIFHTVPDRGPNADPVDTDNDGMNERPFGLPDYQARLETFTLDPNTGEIEFTDQIFLQRFGPTGLEPISGLPNIDGADEDPVDVFGNPTGLDSFGADMEGVAFDKDGNFWMVDEYRPAIYKFNEDGILLGRFVPEGTAELAGASAGSFGIESLPEDYADRRPNRGFEAVAVDNENEVVYAFIQTPLANPDRDTSDASDVIRILGIDMNTGEPVSEHVYLLEGADVGLSKVDKIGDAVYAGDGKFFVIERDSSVDAAGKKFIFEVDLTGATNLLAEDAPALPEGETLEQQTPDDLHDLGIEPVNKTKVTNLPSLGYQAGDKPEGLTLLPDGRLVVINDNDFGLSGDLNTETGELGLLDEAPVVLGIIDFTKSNGLDASDEDGGINIQNHPVHGMFMPDAIASYEVDGRTFYVTANEGDARDEDARIADLDLDPDAFPNADELQQDENLGRLEASTIDGDLDGDGDIDQLFVYGTRSFSIWDENGNLVFDSGDDFERITAEVAPEIFNSNGDADSFDGRSDNKGPEPEGVAVGEVNGETYAFVGLERVGGVMVYNVSDPSNAEFVQYINTGVAPGINVADGVLDISPEGITFISAEDSPTGSPLLAVAFEESATVSVFAIAIEEAIYDIQGEGHISALEGQVVKTDGIVTAVAFNGFYLQDPEGDGNDATSDGIFVFTGSGGDKPAVGDEVSVTGTVNEFIPGGAGTGNLSVTQIGGVTDLQVLSSGNELPAATIIGQSGRVAPNEVVISEDELPVNLQDEPGNYDPEEDAIDFYESLEGMRVTIEDAVAVSPTRVFSEFSAEFFTLPNQGATSDDGLNERGGINLDSGPDNTGDQNPERVQVQFDPTLFGGEPLAINVGDQVGDVTGVVGYSFGNYEVNATEPITVTPGGLEQEVTSIEGTEDRLTVASYNILNVSADGSDDDQIELLAQQIVNNLNTPDIIGLQEVQDNNGTTNDGTTDATQTLQAIVDAIAAAGGPTYEFFDVEPADGSTGGVPGGNIRNAYLYNPDRVSVDETSIGIIEDSTFDGTRDPLVATFEFNGEEVTIVNNHFTSRFGSTPVFGGPQPFEQAGEAEREAEAQAINDFVDGLLADDPDANVIVLGDLNTFEFANDLTEILPGTGEEQVLTNLTDLLEEQGADDLYTFIFDGNSQILDHIFVTDGLLETAEYDIVHVNNDFVRDDNGIVFDSIVASDHEPVVASFEIGEPEPATFTLQILHASDLEGGVDAIANAPNFAALVDLFEQDTDAFDASVLLSAGDNFLSGPFFSAAGDRGVFRDDGVFNDLYNELFNLPDGSLAAFDALREGGGRVDISIMNILGFDASAIGNHEFDLGSDAFESIIEEDFRDPDGPMADRWVGAQFPYLSANLDFSEDSDLGNLFTSDILPSTAFQTGPDQSQAGNSSVPKIAPATIVEVPSQTGGPNDEKIGVVGATTQLLESLSSPTGTTVIGPQANDMAALAAILQPTIDALTDQGVNKIILVSHLQQFALETELAGLLRGVDVIIAGGSDTLLADDDDIARGLQSGDNDDVARFDENGNIVGNGDDASGQPGDNAYPLVTTNADGKPVAIVSGAGEYSYVGRLVLEFDENGDLIPESIDDSVSGNYATTDDVVAEIADGADPFAEGSKADQVKDLTDAVEGIVIERDGNVFGNTEVFMDGRRESVRTEETNFGNLTADANLAVAQEADSSVLVSFKNGGGIRAPIGEVDPNGTLLPTQDNPLSGKQEGEISQLDIENSLRFNNGLTLLTLTATQLAIVLEHAVAASGPGATPGQFAQVGGLSFSFDATQQAQVLAEDGSGTVVTEGQRIQSAAILDEDGNIVDVLIENGELQGDAGREIRIVTLDFLAGGGDGYPFDAFGTNRVDLAQDDAAARTGAADFAPDGSEQDALAEFLSENFDENNPFNEAETDPEDDERIQNLAVREDTVLDGMMGGGDDPMLLEGTFGDDTLEGGSGDDTVEAGFGDDVIISEAGDDFISAGFGDDMVSAGDGDDTVEASFGDDQISGDEGDDQIDGGFGDDEISGGEGDDQIEGGFGDDQLMGGEGSDDVSGDFGNDEIGGGAGDDRLEGGFGRDTLDGGDGDDELIGGFGRDVLIGGDGDDRLEGGRGRDTLEGGAGDDEMSGGSGRDLFIIGLGDGANVILDFNECQDTIDLSAFNFDSIESVTDIAVQQGNDLVLALDEAEGELLMIRNTEVDQLSQQNVII